MKFLLIIAIAILVIWIWKSDRRSGIAGAAKREPGKRRKPDMLPTEIVACDVCQVHLPRSEALAGPGGIYCSAAHRQQAGRE